MNLPIKKTAATSKTLILAALAVLSFNLRAADAPIRYQAQPQGSKIIIEGDSTVHKWTMTGPIIGGYMELDSNVKLDTAQAEIPGVKDGKLNAKVVATIPVTSVKSGHDIMDGLYCEALKQPTCPKITYKLTEMAVKGTHEAGKPLEFDTKGELCIAGVTNSIAMPVKMETTNSSVKITGHVPLKMTAFGIQPPAPNIGLGLMRCADDVNIVFEWSMAVPAAK